MSVEQECPAFLKPRLRLYLSADIIGSTAHKQSRLGALGQVGASQEASWFTTIQGFYFEAQQSFRTTWNALKEKYSADEHFGDPPELWKTVGDEVIFTKLLTDHRQVATVIQCWIETVSLLREFLHRDSTRLGIKSTVWLAGFPFRNKEVVLSGESFSAQEPIDDYYRENGQILNRLYSGTATGRVLVDYIGPSIDTGFRLTSLASARKLILSVEVAYILALTAPVKASPIESIQLRYDGQVQLKGVLGGGGYPVFWIDLSGTSSADALEDKLTNSATCNRDDIREYCDAFFFEQQDSIFPPFIIADNEVVLRDTPPWYEDHHRNLIKNFYASLTQPAEPDEPAEVSPDFSERFDKFEQLLSEIAKTRREANPD